MGIDRAPEVAASACRVCGTHGARVRFRKGGKAFFRCATCGFVWLEPLPTPAELDAHYRWTYEEGPYTVFASAEEIRLLIARDRLAAVADVGNGGPWLDVGASTGAFVAVARAAGLDAEGIELSPQAVAAAQQAGRPVRVARLEDFAPGRRYRLVTAFDVLEHLLEPALLLERARAWLLPGGALALTVPDVASAAARLLGRAWYFYAPRDHFHYFDRRTITRFLGSHGFDVAPIVRATKPLTAGYIARQVEVFYPGLRAVAALLRRLPAGLRSRPLRLPLGEILVVARPHG